MTLPELTSTKQTPSRDEMPLTWGRLISRRLQRLRLEKFMTQQQTGRRGRSGTKHDPAMEIRRAAPVAAIHGEAVSGPGCHAI
jgi:hypothetical protein